MTIERIYSLAIELGKAADVRGQDEVETQLQRRREDYKKLPEDEREGFDEESLANPYLDTRILYGDHNLNVKSIAVGIDIDVGELLVVNELRKQHKHIDLVISHHPSGCALTHLYTVLPMQADIMARYGVPINVAQWLTDERAKEVERKFLPINYNRARDIAVLLDIPFMCIHTPADNLVTSYLQKKIDEFKPFNLAQLLKFLKGFEEYKIAVREGAGPRIIVGNPNNRAGKVVVDMTGGTEGAKGIIERLSISGVGTLVGMHQSEQLRKEAEKHHINVIIAGHISSDTFGMNLFLDHLEKEEKLEIIPLSGFRRITHGSD